MPAGSRVGQQWCGGASTGGRTGPRHGGPGQAVAGGRPPGGEQQFVLLGESGTSARPTTAGDRPTRSPTRRPQPPSGAGTRGCLRGGGGAGRWPSSTGQTELWPRYERHQHAGRAAPPRASFRAAAADPATAAIESPDAQPALTPLVSAVTDPLAPGSENATTSTADHGERHETEADLRSFMAWTLTGRAVAPRLQSWLLTDQRAWTGVWTAPQYIDTAAAHQQARDRAAAAFEEQQRREPSRHRRPARRLPTGPVTARAGAAS